MQNIAPTDSASCDNAASFLQSGFWGTFKTHFKWSLHSFSADWGKWGANPIMVLRRPLIAGFSFAYLPWGPHLDDESDFPYDGVLIELAQALQPLLPPSTAFIRFDPPWHSASSEIPNIKHKLLKSAEDVQAPHTVIVDLVPDEKDILSRMKSKCRYNIGLAAKKGVKVRRMAEEDIDTFYALLQETALRDKISIHSLRYYKKLFAHAREYSGVRPKLHLYGAEYEGELLASIVILIYRRSATYLYGASSNRQRNLMATYTLQWQAMKDAKEAGCTGYDLFGIPPCNDPSHPMHGLYQFKTGFGGTVIHRLGCYDYTYIPAVAKLFSTAQILRRKALSVLS